MREQVQRLLHAYQPQSSFMQKPAPECIGLFLDDEAAAACDQLEGTTIGRYLLLGEIGSGGMGTVYRARQLEPVERQVAIKVVKAGMDTRDVLARFQAERQALATMNHPNIASVLDAGATETGRPYFVMEYVDGQPITEFCDTHHLTIRERLELMCTVCDAIQHAHQKGIVHRDLKPTNILVQFRDTKPIIKVIDFGIQKSIDQRQPSDLSTTGRFQPVGTPLYMSPEQAAGIREQIDTRTDVYSLGATLYELLSGHTPFDKETIQQASFENIRRTIIEQQPRIPSRSVVSDSLPNNTTLMAICAARQVAVGRLRNLLQGELDWITMKAMEKDPARRYQSPNVLALDLQRFLNNEAVVAGPPSELYRLSKAIRRNRWAVLFVLMLSFAMLLGTGVSLYLARIAGEARNQANEYLDQSRSEQARYRKLAWESTIREAYSEWENQRLATASGLLEKLRTSDPNAEHFPEWQLLDQQISGLYRRLLKVGQPLHEVRCIPNARLVATAGGDGNVYIVAADSGKTQHIIQTGIRSVHALAVSPDGTQLAVGGSTDVVTDRARALVFDISTMTLIQELLEQETTIESLEFSTDGKWLASGSRYKDVQVVATAGDRPAVLLPASRRNLWLARSPVGSQLATEESSMSVWLSDFQPPFTGTSLSVPKQLIQALWAGQSNRLIGFLKDPYNVYVFDLTAGRMLYRLDGIANATCFAFNHDASLIVGGLESGGAVCWRIPSLVIADPTLAEAKDAAHETERGIEEFGRWKLSNSPITSVDIADGSILVVSYDGNLVQLRLPGNEDRLPQNESRTTAIAWSSDRQKLLIGCEDGTVYSTDKDESSVTTTAPQGMDTPIASRGEAVSTRIEISPAQAGAVTAVVASDDRRMMAWARKGVNAVILRQNGTERLLPFDDLSIAPGNDHDVMALMFSPKTNCLAWTVNRYLCWTDLLDHSSSVRNVQLPGLGSCLVWSPDGATIFVGGNSDSISRIEADSGILRTYPDVGVATDTIVIDAAGQTVYSGHNDGAIRSLNLRDESVSCLHAHRSKVRSICLSHDGRLGVSSDEDSNVSLWFADSMEEIGTLCSLRERGPDNAPITTQLTFSPDDRELLAATFTLSQKLMICRWPLRRR